MRFMEITGLQLVGDYEIEMARCLRLVEQVGRIKEIGRKVE